MERTEIIQALENLRLDGWLASIFGPLVPNEPFEDFYFYRRTKEESVVAPYERIDVLFLLTKRRLLILRAETSGVEEVDPGPRAASIETTELSIPLRNIKHIETSSSSDKFQHVPMKMRNRVRIEVDHIVPGWDQRIELPNEESGYKQQTASSSNEREVSDAERGDDLVRFARSAANVLG